MSARFCDDCGMRKAVCRELGACVDWEAQKRALRKVALTPDRTLGAVDERVRAPLTTIVREFAAAGGDVPDDLEDKLRASIALNDRKRMAHEDLYEKIEETRSKLLKTIDAASERIDADRKIVAEAREALRALPRPPIQRASKKLTTEQKVEAVSAHVNEHAKALEG